LKDVLPCVDQKTQVLRKELTERIDENQVDLQTVRTSADTRTKNLLEITTDTRQNFHEKLGLIIQGETKMTKSLTDIMRRGIEAKMTEVDAPADRRRETATGVEAAKPPKFEEISWAMFRHQFERVSEYKCWTRQMISAYLITAMQGRTTDVLHGVTKGATYERNF
jgi:hypothetical protein